MDFPPAPLPVLLYAHTYAHLSQDVHYFKTISLRLQPHLHIFTETFEKNIYRVQRTNIFLMSPLYNL